MGPFPAGLADRQLWLLPQAPRPLKRMRRPGQRHAPPLCRSCSTLSLEPLALGASRQPFLTSSPSPPFPMCFVQVKQLLEEHEVSESHAEPVVVPVRRRGAKFADDPPGKRRARTSSPGL